MLKRGWDSGGLPLSLTSIIAIDPGKTTGIVGKQMCWQATNAYEVLQVLDTLPHPPVIVLEDFVLRGDKALQLAGQNMYSSEIIGAVKYFSQKHNITLVTQPAHSLRTISDVLLKSARLWDVTRGMPHARDAGRHLLYYLLRRHYKDVQQHWFTKETIQKAEEGDDDDAPV